MFWVGNFRYAKCFWVGNFRYAKCFWVGNFRYANLIEGVNVCFQGAKIRKILHKCKFFVKNV